MPYIPKRSLGTRGKGLNLLSEKQTRKSAWVIYFTDTSAASHVRNTGNKYYSPYTVMSVVSARRGSTYIKDFMRNLFFVFNCDLDSQIRSSKYNKPHDVFSNFPLKGETDITCKADGILYRGQKSKILNNWRDEKSGLEWLEWQGVPYPRYRNNPDTHNIELVKTEKPSILKAPKLITSTQDIFVIKPR